MPKLPLRALQTLIPDREPGRELETARVLPRASIRPNPWQPRRHADPERLAELAADIGARGILQPIVVRPVGANQFEVIAGERRYQAAGVAGLADLPVIIREDLDESEARAIALVENLQREDLDVEDEARFLEELHSQGLSLREIGALIHKSYQYVNRRLHLLADPATLDAYRAGEITLKDVVSERGPAPAPVAMAELAEAAQVAADQLQAADFVTRSNSSSPAPAGDAARADVSGRVIKPFHKLEQHIRHAPPATVPPDARPDLKRMIDDLIGALTVYRRGLDDEEATE